MASRKKPPNNPKRSSRRKDAEESLDLFRPGTTCTTGRPARCRSVALFELRAQRHTARALPDVRDGLKPVQRRILYTMWQQHLIG